MSERRALYRALLRRAAAGVPWGIAGGYLVFLLGNLFAIPAPEGTALPVVTAALAARWGNPVTAALVQCLWTGLLGAVLGTAGLPFCLERKVPLWSALHFLLTAAALTLAGWQCRWFPLRETWLCLLGVTLLGYLLLWAVRYAGWRQDLRSLRQATALPPPPARRNLPWSALAAAMELALPWVLRWLDPPDVPLLTGLFYPFLLLPLFCLFSAAALGRRQPWPWVPAYAAVCAALTLPNVFLLYNASALFQAGAAGIAALLGGGWGLLRARNKKI